jgi:hypothetical protein
METNGALAPFSGALPHFYYLNRKKKKNSFNNIRPNIYNQRVDNNVTKQFREIHSQKENNEYITDTITDAQGLERAYQHGDYYIHGDTMYIAGSHTAKDWYDDVTKIPVWGDLRDSTRYKAARDALMENPQVKRTIGHSLGGSVALELEKNYKHITSSRTYGAPVWNPLGSESNKVERYRNWIDPVSVFDRSAVKSVKWNPFESTSLTHDYSNIANDFTSSKQVPASTENPDGSVSLIG